MQYYLIKNEKVLNVFDYKDINDNICSLWIPIEGASKNNDWLKWLKHIFNAMPNLQFKSIAFGYNLEDIKNKSVEKTVKKILTKLSDHCENLELVSLAKTADEKSNEDMVFVYDDQVKNLAHSVGKAFPKVKVAMLEVGCEEDKANATSFEGIAKNNLMISEEKINVAREKIAEIAQMIKSKTQSPYERHLLALHFVSQFVYILDDKNQSYLSSRSLSEIISNNAKYICCGGYGRFYTEIMCSMGFEVSTCYGSNHLRAKVLLQDEKYNINGVYAVEPTWLSRKKEEQFPNFRFNKLCNMSMKSIRNSVLKYTERDYIGSGVLNAYNRDVVILEKLKKDISEREFLSKKDIISFLDGEYFEKKEKIFIKIEEVLLPVLNEFKNKPLSGKDVVKLLSDKIELNPVEKGLEQYLKKDINERKKEMADFLNNVFSEKLNNLDIDNLCETLETKAIERGFPLAIAKQAFSESKLYDEISYLLSNWIEEGREETAFLTKNKDKVFKIIYKQAIQVAINGSTIDRRSIMELRIRDSKFFEKHTGETTWNNWNKGLNAISENFTRLSDKEFKKVFDDTKEISDQTLMKAAKQIETLIKLEDYKLFVQDLSGIGANEDEAQLQL